MSSFPFFFFLINVFPLSVFATPLELLTLIKQSFAWSLRKWWKMEDLKYLGQKKERTCLTKPNSNSSGVVWNRSWCHFSE